MRLVNANTLTSARAYVFTQLPSKQLEQGDSTGEDVVVE